MKNRIILSKLTYIGKVMAKSLPSNMCRRALINGKLVCKGKDLLTECENWSRELRIQNVTKVCIDTNKMKETLKHLY